MERGLRYSRKGEEIVSGRTRWLGLNFRACGGQYGGFLGVGEVHTSALGVGSVWMNMVRRANVADGAATLWLHDCAVGLCCSLEAVMGDACWCRHLVAMRGVADRRDGVARDRLRMAERGITLEAIFCIVMNRVFGM